MSSSSTQTQRRIPGAPPTIFFEGADFSYSAPAPEAEPEPKKEVQAEEQHIKDPKGKGKQKEEPKAVNSIYGGEELPVLGRPYGFREAQQNEDGTAQLKPTSAAPKRKLRTKSLNPYEELLAEADSDLDRYVEGPQHSSSAVSTSQPGKIRTALDYFRRTGNSGTKKDETPDEELSPPPFPTSSDPPTTCVVCCEDFNSRTKPPAWISLACAHEPAVCTPCIQQSIKSDLESKMWNKIQCPECGTLLIYEDIKRLADAITFARYEILSFRSALSTDQDFIWCQNCNFGQLHTSGSTSPIVRCLNCNHKTCFNHQVLWHSRMTCAEYDQMVADPENFVPAVDKSNAEIEAAEKLQKEEDEKIARDWSHRERLAEQERQREKHRQERRRAKEEQREVGKKNREEYEKQKAKDDLVRRLKEEKASLGTVQKTTKRCPGCQWPIEKNAGCAHMTCIKCNHEFCWDCLSPYAPIRSFGNSYHGKNCPYHSDNLPL